MTRGKIATHEGVGATANLKWDGSSHESDALDLELLARRGATWIVAQEVRDNAAGSVTSLFLKRNKRWRVATDRSRPECRVVPIYFDNHELKLLRLELLEVKIGWLGKLGAGEDSIRVKIIPAALFEVRDTGQRFEVLGGHNLASAWRGGKGRAWLLEKARRVAGWHKFNRAWFGRHAANRRRGLPSAGGQDGNGTLNRIGGYMLRGWRWVRYAGKSHAVGPIDWLGGTTSFRWGDGHLVDAGRSTDHKLLRARYVLRSRGR